MPKINLKDISAADDEQDIFVLSDPGDQFVNFGDLETSGDLSSGIRAAADGVTVSNFGGIVTTGNGSPGIVAGDAFGEHRDHVTIANFGSIRTSGSLFDDGISFAFADGIDVFGDHARIFNFGTITVVGTESGIGLAGENSTIVNHGAITTTGFAGIVLDTATGIVEQHNLVVNFGHIHAGDTEFNYGILSLTGANIVRNYGTIEVDGFHSFAISLESAGNLGENYGSILATGDEGRGVLLFGEGHIFINYGAIDSSGAGGIGVRIDSDGGSGLNRFANHGIVSGDGWAVLGGQGADHVTNRGQLNGDVELGAGDDLFVAERGGVLDGLLVLGDGNDLVIVQRRFGGLVIADFEAGAGSDDMIDVRAFRFGSFGDLMAHSSQSGDDVLIGLGSDQILLQNTALVSLNAADFMIG